MNKIYEIKGVSYQLISSYKNGFSLEDILEKWTDYFEGYDYIVGDYAYDKLRLKGFCVKQNKKYNAINKKENIEKYIKEDCAYECRYFVLEKIKSN